MRPRTLVSLGLLALLAACSQPVAAPRAGHAAPARDEVPAAEPGDADSQSQGYYGSGHNDPPPDSTATQRDGGS